MTSCAGWTHWNPRSPRSADDVTAAAEVLRRVRSRWGATRRTGSSNIWKSSGKCLEKLLVKARLRELDLLRGPDHVCLLKEKKNVKSDPFRRCAIPLITATAAVAPVVSSRMRSGGFTKLVAVLVALAVSISLTAAAPASAHAGRSHHAAGSEPLIIHTRYGLALTPAPPLPAGIPIAGVVTLNVHKEYPATPGSTLLGYFFCLYHAYDSCIGENRGEPGDAPASGPRVLINTDQVLAYIVDSIGSGVVYASVVAILKVAKSVQHRIR
jgi:hypothetical protein